MPNMPNIKKVKQEAWNFYNLWRKMKTYSPAFKSEVRVSLKGWRHLIGAAKEKKRSTLDLYRRLMLLKYAKEIIKESTTIQNIITKRGRIYYALEAVKTVRESGIDMPRKIRVIVVEDLKGNKIFYSVMDKKTRNDKTKEKS